MQKRKKKKKHMQKLKPSNHIINDVLYKIMVNNT